ncbi:MAG: TetR family transcriptional regulator C-terminal domain-containing protein [Kofleriaceae bacterium]|nr:TetR family transcriptional regulator C-terminal domain-containing protein [Kofleriaceae bacterium]
MHTTKLQLLEAGLKLLLERGYNDLGVQTILEATGTPKGSFYHHFTSKEDFALQVVDLYMQGVHQGLDAFLTADNVRPLQRIRNFFEATRDHYRSEGYLGCMLGGLGQELSGVNESFATKIEQCLTTIGDNLATCLTEAKRLGDLPESADPHQMSMVLVNCWEGAALRSRLQRREAPLDQMLDFCFQSALRT